MPSTDGDDYTFLPQLLKANGDYFGAMVYVRDYLPPYTHRYVEEVVLGDNSLSRAVVGDSWSASDSATLEVWGAGAYVEVSAAATEPTTNGILTLRVPDLNDPADGDLYSVTMVIPTMTRALPRREGSVQMFTVGVENIRVLGHETY